MIAIALAVILVVSGLVFFLGAAVGLLRFPDCFTRMHAAGKGDTLSSLLVIMGFAVYLLRDFSWSGGWPELLVALKLFAICVFIMVTSPTSTHALMDASLEEDIKPLIDGENALEDYENPS